MNGKRNPKINTIRAFFPKTRTLSWFSNKGRGNLPLSSSWMPVNVVEYASISLNIHKCPWKCLNKLFWLSQDSEYAWSSYMFDRLLKMAQVLNVPGLYGWHSYICKDYTEFQIWLNMLQYGFTSLNMSEHDRILLNVSEYTWKCLNKLFWLTRFLNMPHHLR